MAKIIRVVLGAFTGAVFGTILGFAVAAAVGFAFRWLHPDDPTAGSAAIIGIVTVPMGFVGGAVVGGTIAGNRTAKS